MFLTRLRRINRRDAEMREGDVERGDVFCDTRLAQRNYAKAFYDEGDKGV